MADPGLPSAYACSCLNVRIHPLPPPASPTDSPDSSNFLPVYVGEDGIAIVRLQPLCTHASGGRRSRAALHFVAESDTMYLENRATRS